MMAKAFRIPAAILFSSVLVVSELAAQQVSDSRIPTLQQIFVSDEFTPEKFTLGRWAQHGAQVTFVDKKKGVEYPDLVSYHLETDERSVIIAGELLHAPDVDRLTAIEDYQFNADRTKVLLFTDAEKVWREKTKGFYYVYNLADSSLTPVSARDDGFQMFAKFSPVADEVAFVRDRNIFVVDMGSGVERQLTMDGSEGGIINGTSDWVYEEEFRLRDGWSWSPDGRHIAFVQLDETETREYAMADLRERYPRLIRFRYPKAGERNSEIHVGVIDVASGETRFFDTDTWHSGGQENEYIPTLGWTPDIDGVFHVWLFRMNRDQNRLDLIYGNPATGETRIVVEEKSDTWIDVDQNTRAGANLRYLTDGKHFVWMSERDGYRHAYLYQNDGRPVAQLTKGDWEVTDFHGVDGAAERIYFTAAIESPIERHLYGSDVSHLFATGTGADRETDQRVYRISEGAGWHDVNMSPDFQFYTDTYSDTSTPEVTRLHRNDGSVVNVLESNEDVIETLGEHRIPSKEFVSIPGATGARLNASILKSTDFDESERHPLLIYVYGGPGSQRVMNRWGGKRYLWHAHLVEKYGYVVVSVDGRGTGARGKAFEEVTHERLGPLEAEDQIAAAQHLGRESFIDSSRIGIWGWSYGGFMTLMSMMTGEGPETFDAGISVAPVTTWRQYDTIYTERYMSTPQDNKEGYEITAPQYYADRLREDQDLLIVHGDLDDNVHYQNAVQMVEALQQAGKQFSFMVYPGKDHSIAGKETQLHLYRMMTDFLVENL